MAQLQDYQDYIQRTLFKRASELHPGRPDLQRMYVIGFLQGQLAQAFHGDSQCYYRFKTAVDKPLR